MRIRHLEGCNTCTGTGVKPGSKSSTCGQCGGQGVVIQATRTPLGAFQTQTTCPTCRGAGEVSVWMKMGVGGEVYSLVSLFSYLSKQC